MSEEQSQLLPIPTPVPNASKQVVFPIAGEVITSIGTGNSYTIGDQIGEGSFGKVYACTDVWKNELAVKILKPIGTYDKVKASAQAEVQKLFQLRHPYITYVHDAFEFRDTFYIVTERCNSPLTDLFAIENFKGMIWLLPIARCLLQAVNYVHINGYAHQDIHLGNVFSALVKDEIIPKDKDAMNFKLGDLGVAKLFAEVNAQNTRAEWMLPPEVGNSAEFGPIDKRVDIYHLGLMLLQVALSKEIKFTSDDILQGKPRELALTLPAPYNFALEKALRRHVQNRTADAMELWRDLNATSSISVSPHA